MEVISDSSILKEKCDQLSQFESIAIDTEFIRTNTYYPIPCLIQAANEAGAYAFDLLAQDIDISPLISLILDENITKIFHSGKQDLEIIYNLSSQIPKNVFDTQIAAMACGFGNNISYAKLVSIMLNIDLDKKCKLTNWTHRPLSKEQIEYALDDVIHLHNLYSKILSILKERGRLTWLEEEIITLLSPSNYELDSANAWKRIKIRNQNGDCIGIVKDLGTWRELKAISENKPRGHILKDDVILDIAQIGSKNLNNLTRTVHKKIFNKSFQKEILSIVKDSKAFNLYPDNFIEKNYLDIDNNILEMLKILLKIRCDKNKISKTLVANTKDLSLIALGNIDQTNCAQGWRFDIFGKYAIKMLEGKVSLTINNNQVEISNSEN